MFSPSWLLAQLQTVPQHGYNCWPLWSFRTLRVCWVRRRRRRFSVGVAGVVVGELFLSQHCDGIRFYFWCARLFCWETNSFFFSSILRPSTQTRTHNCKRLVQQSGTLIVGWSSPFSLFRWRGLQMQRETAATNTENKDELDRWLQFIHSRTSTQVSYVVFIILAPTITDLIVARSF